MSAPARLTITTLGDDPRACALLADAHALGITEVRAVRVADIVFLDASLTGHDRTRLESVLVEPLLQTATWDTPHLSGSDDATAVETVLQAGVTDPVAEQVRRVAALFGVDVAAAASGHRYEISGELDPPALARLVDRLLANPVVERWGSPLLGDPFGHALPNPASVERVPIRDLDEAGLAELDASRAMALDPAELLAVQAHFRTEGRDPTDVELEMIAQTWSEHCAHKTFRATIVVGGSEHRPLLSRLRDTTQRIAAPFVRSAFDGNAGVVGFLPGRTFALKAETHNHPSAVEPFGGANTGVGGVLRDILGSAHRPIACTDVLCFGPLDTPPAVLSDGVLHPRRIASGVVAGVADYGNKTGLPTVAGAILFDSGYTANPLVFCGSIGVAPEDPPLPGPQPGDRVVAIGGRTGRDGLRGATFSSATMDASTGEVAGASVQIGDPITGKLLIDVVDEARAEALFDAITDCGAGGFSSAIGEMAEGVGAAVELASAPLKYPGLSAWEIWLSEAQERMVLAVAPSRLPRLRAVCDRHGVELTDLGSFTGDGRLVVRHHGDVVAELDTVFLHDGRPQRSMVAVEPLPRRELATPGVRRLDDLSAALLGLLAHPNIASRADVVHRYDYEIRGATVVRPLAGPAADGPADGVVLAEPAEDAGLAIGIGVNPWFGLHDPYRMAWAAVDEAIRNVVAAGADPQAVALLDNFSWGDPRRPETLGALAAAVDGCCDAALTFGAPFVSGKDSLNNEYLGSDGERHAVPPTLVITAVAHVPDISVATTTDLKTPGDLLVLIGSTAEELAGSHLDLLTGAPPDPGMVPAPDPTAPARYRGLHAAMRAGLIAACHDLSEGGLAVAVAEMCIGAGLGATLGTLPHPDPVVGWFGESIGRLLVEIAQADLDEVRHLVPGEVTVVGHVSAVPELRLPGGGPIPLDALRDAWRCPPTTTGAVARRVHHTTRPERGAAAEAASR